MPDSNMSVDEFVLQSNIELLTFFIDFRGDNAWQPTITKVHTFYGIVEEWRTYLHE